MDELIGQAFGPYTITEKIAEGGMAVVYKGYQESLNRYVAIKVLRRELTHDSEFVTRFRREAMAVARLRHSNVLHVYDANVAHGWYYIVMDYVAGGSLKDRLARGPLPINDAISISVQVADALGYAHRQGLIHRDIKPANILVSHSGQPLLTDFGIAKALDESTHLTRAGTNIGTPAYMAPEQAKGQPADRRTDIYALGIVLYEMLTGLAPFRAQTPVATLYQQVNEPPPPLRRVNAQVPVWLELVVNRALTKRPEERYQKASEFAEALRRQQAPLAVPKLAAHSTGSVAQEKQEAVWRTWSPVQVLLAAIGLVFLVLLASGAILVLGSGDEPPTPTLTRMVLVASPAPTVTLVSVPVPTTPNARPTATIVTVTASSTFTPMPSPTLKPTASKTRTRAPTPTRRNTSTYTPSPTSTPERPMPTLAEPLADAELHGSVTFKWDYPPGRLGLGNAFEVRIWKEGTTEHLGAAEPVRAGEQPIDLDVLLPNRGGQGKYFWTVVVIRKNTGKELSPEADPRPFTYVVPSSSPGSSPNPTSESPPPPPGGGPPSVKP